VLKVVSFSNDLIWVFLVCSSGFCGISLVQKWFLESDKSQLLWVCSVVAVYLNWNSWYFFDSNYDFLFNWSWFGWCLFGLIICWIFPEELFPEILFVFVREVFWNDSFYGFSRWFKMLFGIWSAFTPWMPVVGAHLFGWRQAHASLMGH
jgi:hypothetical protein